MKNKANEKIERAEHPHFCRYCEFATPLHDEGVMLCAKNGAVTEDYICRKWRYDPMKRTPKPQRAPLGIELASIEDI